MNKSLLSAALLSAFMPLAWGSAADTTASWLWQPATSPALSAQTALPRVPADYSAWVRLPVDTLFALPAGSQVAFNLPDLGQLDVTLDGIRALDTRGQVLEWRGHRTDSPDDQVVLVRDLRQQLSGALDLGPDRLLLGHANGEYLLYRAGVDSPADLESGDRPTLRPLADQELAGAADRAADKPAEVAFPVRLDLVSLADLPLGAETEFTLPEVGTFTVVHDQTLAGDLGASTFVGYLKDYGDDFRVIITSTPTGSEGSILSPHGEFKLLTRNDQTWVVDVARSGLRNLVPDHDCQSHAPDPGQPAASPDGLAVTMAAGAAGVGEARTTLTTTTAAATASNTTADGKTVVDVLVLYGPGLEQRLGASQALTRIQHLVALANQAYTDSKVNISLRLVKAAKLDGLTDASSNSQTLSDLAAGRGVFAPVPGLRSQYGADLVTVVRPFYMNGQGRSCGVGYVGGYGGNAISLYGAYAYSVVSDGQDMEGSPYYCLDYTFTHELGHNMGSMHDRTTVASQGGGTGAYPYSYGYGKSGQFGTIMSYISPVVGKFSNPSLTSCGGSQPCGVSSSSASSADNAQSLNNTRAAVAAFMGSTAVQSLYISGLASVGGSPLAGVTVSGTGATCSATGSNGAYSCQVPSGWTGTLSPTLAGYTFSPTSLKFSKLTASKTNQNWKATGIKLNLSGNVTLAGKPLSGVVISGNGATCSKTTSRGAFSCQVAYNWSGSLTASKAGYSFSPSPWTLSGVKASRTDVNWTARKAP